MSETSEKGLKGGAELKPVLTAGGHVATTSEQPAFPDFHRKLADPTSFAWLAFGGTLIVYGCTVLGFRGIELFSAVVPICVGLGSLLLYLATIFEFLAGRTLPGTMYGIYAGFFGGFVVLHVSWFGLTGSYDGVTPNTYAVGGAGEAQLASLQGIWTSTFIILTALFLLAATHQSGMLVAFLTSLELFFILQTAAFLMDGANPVGSSLYKATGAFAILSGILAFYLALASLLTKESAFFTLPTFDFIKKT